MIGEAPTLKDIILTETPVAVDLFCDEQMPTEEEFDELDSLQLREGPRPREQVFVIYTACGRCEADIRVCIECEHQSVLILEQLLLQDLQILCPECYLRLS